MLAASFTIVIPVTHSLSELSDCFDSIEKLSFPTDRIQVAVVDCLVVTGLQEFYLSNLSDRTFHSQLLELPKRDSRYPKWLIEARMNEARNLAIKSMPAAYFVFTEDDCTFEPLWLRRYESAYGENVGMMGGPDLLPPGLGWFATALDIVLNSRIGSGRMRHGGGLRTAEYYPRKQNMVVPASVFERIGLLDENRPVSGEIDLAARVRKVGLRVVYLSDNPVWHRRINSLCGFFRLSVFTAAENVKLLRVRKLFFRSAYSIVFAVCILTTLLVIAAVANRLASAVFIGVILAYGFTIGVTAFIAGVKAKDVMTGCAVLALTITHHLSIVLGTALGVFGKVR